ncbi:MAG: DegV family protein [Firmicutes bacterium]|nr:DegV family protein [Bacillota bacterium]
MIKILVDASSDYTADEVQQKGLILVPIEITIGDKVYIEGINLDRSNFYEILKESDDFPKTSQPSPQTFADIFAQAEENGDELVCILLSSQLSGTFQSASLAKEMVGYDKIYLVDSLSASFCIKVMADYALSLVEQGFTAPEIAEKIERFKSHVKCIAGLNTLEFLAKGGRISKAVAAVGSMANIKPIIKISETGSVEMAAKCIGMSRAIVQVVRTLQGMEIDDNFPIYPLYSYGTENCESFETKMEDAGFKMGVRSQIGPTIGTHIGPEAFGVVFVTKGGTD